MTLSSLFSSTPVKVTGILLVLFVILMGTGLVLFAHHTVAPVVTPPPVETLPTISTTTPATSTPATSTPVVIKKSAPVVTPKKPVVVTTTVTTVTTTTTAPPVVVTPPPLIIVATSTTPIVYGATTLAVDAIPLLSGGTAHAGQTIAVSYLQITNVGKAYTELKGFTLAQKGSALPNVVIGFSTVDDRGGARGTTGGIEGATPFVNGTAEASTDEILAPGEMRLFTVKALLSKNVAAYVGTNLQLVVTGLDTTAATQGQFPIAGTTWTIAN